MRIVGVDPGCYGALALLVDGKLDRVLDMPILKIRRGKSDKAEVEAFQLATWLCEAAPDVVCVEQVGGIPGQSAPAAFNFGRAAGAPEYIAKAFGIRVEMTPPANWKRALKLNTGKDAARAAAMRLFPASAEQFKRVKDDGRAEAALIAYWFQRQETPNNVFS